MYSEPIAIIGAGCRFPGEIDSPSKLWEFLKQPQDLLSEIPPDRYNAAAFYHPNGKHHGTTNVRHSYFLKDDPRAWDASFFATKPQEAECMDPQHRLTLEVVYEALCNAGLRMEDLRGSSTAAYVGIMSSDYTDIMQHDLKMAPIHFGVGVANSLASNRISYFFDWHGPSVTLDTACSGSLVAVHHAVRALRNGDCSIAVASGSNLLLGPKLYVAESKLSMLSPSGRSRMWDAAGDGYGRGEGIAAVILKTLDQALKDGDQIDCIIKETGVNQDGRTLGITMPSNIAQEALIRETYRRAGLDSSNPVDRCQYFEAHGTGTPAGDPQESQAISRAFFGDRARGENEDPLYVGSIKTVVGHTEGTAGVAGLLKAYLAVKNGIIPPNLLFEKLSPRVQPYYGDLRITTECRSWPALPSGVPRRASVNSFGYGGTNCHVIIEQFVDLKCNPSIDRHIISSIPLTISANNEVSLRDSMQRLLTYLKSHPNSSIRDVSYTLYEKRSLLPFRVAIPARDTSEACANLEKRIEEIQADGDRNMSVVKTKPTRAKPRVLGIFTGQGAQWPAMGKMLLQQSLYAQEIIAELDEALGTLPIEERPSWTLLEELQKTADTSRVYQAEFSQPLCAAVQILLVTLLRAANIDFATVVGHSSGEIGCAFAAGCLTASQAIKVAYLRGRVLDEASSPSGVAGGMLAVGASLEEARDLCDTETFAGRICVAASNGPDSVTLSGDLDAILMAKEVLDGQHKFARQLRVDRAYHSHHMKPCARSYIQSLIPCLKSSTARSRCTWFSSVRPPHKMMPEDANPHYWKDNLVSPVLFAQAVEAAFRNDTESFDVVIEVGPHPSLKGPCLSTIQGILGKELPYFGFMERGQNDWDAFSSGLGSLWELFGANAANAPLLDTVIGREENVATPNLIKDLPLYPWDHRRSYYRETRLLRNYLFADEKKQHPFLGTLDPNTTMQSWKWHNILLPREMSWLDGHRLQGLTVLPGAFYVVMAMEAALLMLPEERLISLMEVQGLEIGKAITFDGEDDAAEVVFSADIVRPIPTDQGVFEFRFQCDSCLSKERTLSWSAKGVLHVVLGPESLSELAPPSKEPPHLMETSPDLFYQAQQELGFGYTGHFRGMTSIRRATGHSRGTIRVAPPFDEDTSQQWIIHPATLDIALQTPYVAYHAPKDGRVQTLYVPVIIKRIAVNPNICRSTVDGSLDFAASNIDGKSSEVCLSVNGNTAVQIEGLESRPFSDASEAEDRAMFSEWVWKRWPPKLADDEHSFSEDEIIAAAAAERATYYYVKQVLSKISNADRQEALPHHQRMFEWADHILALAASGKHPSYQAAWETDNFEHIERLIEHCPTSADLKLIKRIGENLSATIFDDVDMFEIVSQDGLIEEFLHSKSCITAFKHLEEIISSITHRYPDIDVLEIGAGTGIATKYVLRNLASVYKSYTLTDISASVLKKAEGIFSETASRMLFRILDISASPESQGFKPHTYDVIVAANVFHATADLTTTLANARTLLKPGGYILMIDITNTEQSRFDFIFGALPEWWESIDDGRALSPVTSQSDWDSLLRKNGFSGIEIYTPSAHNSLLASTLMVSRYMTPETNALEQPLSSVFRDSTVPPSDIPISVIGGMTPAFSQVLEDLNRSLPDRAITSHPRIQDTLFEEKASYILLSEMESPLFSSLDEDVFDRLKDLFKSARNILWITVDAYTENPYQAMVIGFTRTLRLEYPEVCIQILDFQDYSDIGGAQVASALLRLESNPDMRPADMLWTTEPELHFQGGDVYIPRVKADTARNLRYNSRRRRILEPTPLISNVISIVAGADGESHFGLSKNISTPADDNLESERVNVEVRQSLLNAIAIGESQYLYLVHGWIEGTRKSVIALTESHSSLVEVPVQYTLPCSTEFSVEYLTALVANLLALRIFSKVAPEKSVIVHEPWDFLVQPLADLAAERNVRLRLITSHQDRLQKKDVDNWMFIHPRPTQKMISSTLKEDICMFWDLSAVQGHGGLGNRLAAGLPNTCWKRTCTDLFRPTALTSTEESGCRSLIEIALKNIRSTHINPCQSVCVSNVTSAKGLDPYTILDWTTVTSLPTLVQPIDSTDLFAPNKTYVLIGLTGDLGRGLCRWMIWHGARYIVLASRNPKIDTEWLEMLKLEGATVQSHSIDVSKRASVRAALDRIQDTLPPIAGIAHAPMILQDALFENMDFESMKVVLEAKVQGGVYLDEYFDNQKPLDFFICFSSLAAVAGNSGQSNYTAANSFLATLTAQRKRRGLAGSCIDLSAVHGVGYIAKASRESNYELNPYTFVPISEQDVDELFAEAVIAGQPEKDGKPVEIITGIPNMEYKNREHIQSFDDTRISFWRLPNEESRSDQTASHGFLSVREKLMLAADIDGAFEVLKDALAAKLRSIMRLPSTEPVDEDVPLIDQGVDSLVAVTLRTWFSKELSADVPVLRIIGGASLSELSQNVLEKLDAAALPLVSDSPGEEAEDDVQSSTSSSKTGISQDSGEGLSTPASPPGFVTPESEGVDDSNFSELPENSKIDPILDLSSENFSWSSDIQAREAPMSYSQLRFWAMKSFVPDQSFFTVAIGFWITDPKIDRLRHAVDCIIQRHEIFRTRFCDNEDGIPTQMVSSISNVNLEQVACSDRQAASEGFKNLSNRCFDPASGDTICFTLFDWGQKEKLVAIAYHHMILDGAGFDILFNELNLLHLGHSDLPPPFQYIDFSVQQRKDIEEGNMSEDIAYWRSEFQGLPSPLPLLPISLSSVRRDLLAYDQHEATVQLPAMLTARIKDQSRKHKANPIHFYMAALNVLLARFTETSDVCIGMADACRTDENDFKTMGLFLNLLPVRLLFSGDQTFGEMINSARTKVREAVSHNRLPFDVLLQMLNVPRSSLHSPLFQAFLDYRQGQADLRRDPGKIKPGVLNITGIETSRSRTGYDISLEVNDEPLETTVKIKIQKSSYPPEAAILLLNSYVNLLSTFSRNPALAVGGVRMFSKSELDKAVKLGQGELVHTEPTSSLIKSIESFCHETPNSQALESSGVSMSYAEMAARICAISNTLITSQVTAGDHIVVYQHPTPDWICSMLAIMSIGAVCIPVDPSWPTPRQEAVIRSADTRVILTKNETHLSDDSSVPIINISSISTSTESRLQLSVLPRSAPAIVLYSSGTTGAPKGIVLTHGGIMDRVEAMSKFRFDKPRVLQQSAITFDHALTQVFFGLQHGGCVYVVPREIRRDAKAITRLIVDKNIEYTKATPSEYHSWLWIGASTLRQATNWKVAGIGGEIISHSLLEALKILELPQLRVFSDYGPAEATLSSYRIELDYRSQSSAVRIPLGSHLPSVSTFIVDRNRQPVPVGWPGEILIGGPGISSGYLQQPDLTAQSFITDEFSSPEHTERGWTKLFCSGDKGRMREDGSLVFYGRISESTQVKLRGFRVELSDIEQSILDAAEGVVTIAVITVRGELDSKFLVGHLVFVPGLSAEKRDLLLRRLPYQLSVPSYMRPAMLFALEKMPMTSHGKVDRNAVAQIVLPASTAQPSLSGHMEVIWKLWCDVLPQEAISSIKPEGATDFISAGGNSILLVKLQALIYQKLQVDLPLARLLGETTLEGMANICDAAELSSKPINWEEECRLGSDASDLLYSSSTSLNAVEYTKSNGKEGIHVLVTGASGFICRHFLKQLDAIKEVSRISCVAVRQGSYDKLLSESISKVKLYRGDLTSPLLGLSAEHFRDLSESADIIMHCGSDRSFWNPYRLLRATNVLSSKEVIRLAAPRKAPIIFISSGAVDRIKGIADLSHPEVNGYLACKYVNEALLLDAQRLFHIPVTIIRMQDGTANEESLTEFTISRSEVTDAILRMGMQMGKRFQHEELLETSMSFARVSSLAGFLCSEVRRLEVSQTEPSSDAHVQGTIRYNNYNDSVSLSGKEWSTLFGSEYKEIYSEWQKLPVIPTTTWFGEAKKQGFGYLISSQTIKINDMISRR